MYEGQLAGGYNRWTGYGRWIRLAVAVGWWVDFETLRGQGITHTGEHFQYEGIWDGTKFYSAPAQHFKVTDLRTQYNTGDPNAVDVQGIFDAAVAKAGDSGA
jgi:hypothetical protein